MLQLIQDALKNLENKPTWIKESIWEQLKAHWNSSKFKIKYDINKRNHNFMDDASLHTSESIAHRVHWKRIVSLLLDFIF